MEHPTDHVRTLADSVDCITEPDLCLLANITPVTAAEWRKRRRGPSYILLGNRYLYPRTAVADFLKLQLRERPASNGKDVL